ncbi:hypothetical protein Dsin_019330 [Dipteronia sinensis]|uniref:Dirigent protein n=1 Tax=Dipteronia sinensis TaxID=43782 RepID=A0AAE0A7R5_9ROSI|nr:hypothetical protein Dsin_019330 [Dipteronia sinensis]
MRHFFFFLLLLLLLLLDAVASSSSHMHKLPLLTLHHTTAMRINKGHYELLVLRNDVEEDTVIPTAVQAYTIGNGDKIDSTIVKDLNDQREACVGIQGVYFQEADFQVMKFLPSTPVAIYITIINYLDNNAESSRRNTRKSRRQLQLDNVKMETNIHLASDLFGQVNDESTKLLENVDGLRVSFL